MFVLQRLKTTLTEFGLTEYLPNIKVFFEKGRKFVFYNPWFVLPYIRVYCTCLGILPLVCCTIPTDSAQVKIDLIRFLQYCMLACKVTLALVPKDLTNYRTAIFGVL